MKIYRWNGTGDYDYLIRLDEKELEMGKDVLPKTKCLFVNYYYFVNVKRRCIAAPPCMALILGGRDNGCAPYSATSDQLSMKELLEYEGEEFLWPHQR